MTPSQVGNAPTCLPAEFTAHLERWAFNAKNRKAQWLADMLDLRDFLDECRGSKEEMYRLAAPAFGVEVHTLQNKMSVLRDYSPANLTRWLIVKGLALDTLNTINQASKNGDLKLTPVKFIEDVALNGNGNGNPPTRKEIETLIAEATGHPEQYWFNVAGSRFAEKCGVKNVHEFLPRLWALVDEFKR